MLNALLHMVTGKDNETHDIARWSWVLSLLTVIIVTAWNTIHQGTCSMTEFAQAVGMIAAAHGVAIYAKKDTEPSSSEINK
jgi:hypothetical protein